jgi:hypothetical protein
MLVYTSGNTTYTWLCDVQISSNYPYAGCGAESGLLTAVNGILSDGSGPSNYRSHANCVWMIATSHGSVITLRFNQFNTQPHNDVVRLFQCTDAFCLQQQQFAQLSGTYPAQPIATSATNLVKVVFTSDSAGEFDGFRATWTTVSKSFYFTFRISIL